MKLNQLILAGAGAAALFTMSSAQAQTTLAAWNFQSDTVATNNNPVADSGTGTATSIGMNVYPTPNVGITQDDVVLGVSADTGANAQPDLTNVWRVRGQAGTNGAANGWSSAAPIGTQGAQFFTSTAGITSGSINVSFDWYATTQGEANLQFEYTTNGGATWNNLALNTNATDVAGGLQYLTNSSNANIVNGAYISDSKPATNAGQDWFQGLTATITDASALNDSQFGIEMVNAATGTADVATGGTALNNTSGNWRFDNISITATPEPSSWMLGLGAVAVFFVVRRIRRA